MLARTRGLAVAGAVVSALAIGPLARPAVADILFLYDDLGRLVRVIREDGEAATYHWDAVGNLLNNPLSQRDPPGLQAVPIPAPGPVPVPLPPVFIPGTPENEAFARATEGALRAAAAAITAIVTSIVRKCETPRFIRCNLIASEEMTPNFFKCIYQCPDGSIRTRLRVPLRCPPTMEFAN